ncbi:MAG: threo-3-hydroxy-L-aspartate ammonia-lyase [Spirulina sp. SIO3F2]|nr:threo-3-hydroxy-L-aspartate ammonia-lyase [Spirulina sp. SIO3F2]
MSNSSRVSVSYADIQAAAARLAGIAHQTPVLTSRLIDEQTQAVVFFKAENLQRTGSFKFRGAYNAIAQLTPEQQHCGVVTYSSGNHAQAVALAGQLLGVKTTIVMPEDAPAVKLDATRGYGANVLLYDRAEAIREQVAQQVCTEQGAVLIPPYNHPDIIAGQGTVAKELHEAVPDLDLLLVCCGGGGLLSGCGIATKAIAPNCRVIGVEPQAGNDATRSFYSKTLQTVANPQTIADGARTASLGSLTFPLVLQHVNAMATVSDRQLLKTLLFLGERLKVVVEPTGALAATALLEEVVTAPKQRVGVILSGGNVDLPQLLQTTAELRD